MKKNNNQINKKGFTLVELLATVAILCLILGITGSYVIQTMKHSDETATVLTKNSIKKMANTYIEEYPEDVVWNDISGDTSKYTCISTQSLINKGYISSKDSKIDTNKYVLAIKDANQTITTSDSDNKNWCNSTINNTNKIAIPTAKNYCSNNTYTGDNVALVNEVSDAGFTISPTIATKAGNYQIVFNLKDGYVWQDDTRDEKKITCSIKKATPTLQITSNSMGESGKNLEDTTITIRSDVEGTIALKTSNKDVASASISDSNEKIFANTDKSITIQKFSSKKSATYITITLTPTDTNYNKTSVVYTIANVSKKTIDVPKCNVLYFNNQQQLLIKEDSTYYLYNHKQRNVGEYEVTIQAKYGYQFKDSTTRTTQTCEIKAPIVLATYTNATCSKKQKKVKYLETYNKTYSKQDEYKEENLCSPTKTGYTFNKWTTTDGSTINNNSKVNKWTDHNLVANWTANTYSVTLDLNGGKNENNTLTNYTFTATYDKPFSVVGYKPTKMGYAFKGWYTARDGGSKIESGTWNYTSDQIFYAHWTANKYKVTLDLNGGKSLTPATNPLEATYDEDFSVDGYKPTREGYTFDGWYTARDGGSQVKGTWKWTDDSSKTFYAHWTINKYTVSINVNNPSLGTVSPTAINNVPYGTKYWVNGSTLSFSNGTNITASNLTKDYYKTAFSSWSSTSGEIKGNTTITANFTETAYKCTVTFAPNGGTFNDRSSEDDRTKEFVYGVETTKGLRGPVSYHKAKRDGYEVVAGAQWIDRSGKTFTTGNKYSAEQLCENSINSLKTGNRRITLRVNWKAIDTTATCTNKTSKGNVYLCEGAPCGLSGNFQSNIIDTISPGTKLCLYLEKEIGDCSCDLGYTSISGKMVRTTYKGLTGYTCSGCYG